MKQSERDWDHVPPFEAPPPGPEHFEAEEEDSPEFAAIRRIELLGRLHHMAFRSLFHKDGLPPAQVQAMKVIIRHPGLSQRELADKLHIQRATATVMLQKMEKAGVIDRRPDQGDQRISRIYPTRIAQAIDAENRKTVNQYFARCFDRVSEEDKAAMERAMVRLTENLRQILSEQPEPIGKE